MSSFLDELRRLNPPKSQRRWVFVPYDQLSDAIGPVAATPAEELGIVLIENRWKPRRRPYHKQKLALILANMRHFALEQAARGVAVHYVFGDAPYRTLLDRAIQELGPMSMMEAAERELRVDLEGLENLQVVPHEGWLTTPEDFQNSQKKLKSWRMDSFYRFMRKKTGYLMERGKPLGGKLSHDAANREPWSGDPPAPERPRFEVDAVTAEVGELIEQHFAHHPGRLDLEHLPTRKEHAEQLWSWAKRECMTHFGPYEDAMSVRSSGIFHTRVSPLINLHRLLPQQVVEDALELDIPLNSQEGFVRQILGWREFMRHVHRETDGFRNLPGVSEAELPGAAGYDWPYQPVEGDPRGGAEPNFFNAREPLPPTFWGEGKSGLFCLDQVVDEVWDEGYSHHITRLMVLSNLATLLDIDPRQITDWFWVAYIDAYDWVVEPNVLGMGTYALGGLFTTKPYVSGGAYIDRMSDYCQHCSFHPKKNCPITRYFWAFLGRNAERLEGNQRMSMMLRTLSKRSAEKRAEDDRILSRSQDILGAGEMLSPETLS